MKSLFVLLLLIVVVSVVHGKRKCYSCIKDCSEDNFVEMECEMNYCVSFIGGTDSTAASVKGCTENQNFCGGLENEGKCYTCDEDFCNKKDDDDDDDDDEDNDDDDE
ncbi:hypothetical protein MTP99_008332 [Tenebrio molitor]|nr:hypothetical protein MTP99_008332 [Tenebrio molitor]